MDEATRPSAMRAKEDGWPPQPRVLRRLHSRARVILRNTLRLVEQAAGYIWSGPASLSENSRIEWRFVSIRWMGILILVPSLPFLHFPEWTMVGAYLVLTIAAIYNSIVQVLLLRENPRIASGYLTTAGDGLLDIAMVGFGGGFDSPMYYILYTVTVATAIRYGYGPVMAIAVFFVGADLTDRLLFQSGPFGPFFVRSAFLILTAALAAYLHEQTKTAQDSLQEKLKQANALNRELEAFSYSVSHDLRAPLRSIDGFSQALLEDNGADLDETGRDYLHRVRAASTRMAQLIDDLLKLSRVTRSEIQRRNVDLSEMAEQIAGELRQTEPEREVRFTIAGHVTANGDPHLLRLTMENLLGNAWKFTGHQARARIHFGTSNWDGAQAFFVRDNGVGFNMAYADKLFGAFQRLHADGDFQGTGIGLATVQRIVHRHGGQVWAEGSEGDGATFYFTLP